MRPCCGICNPKGKREEKRYERGEAWTVAEDRHQQCQIEILCMENKSPNTPKGMAGTKKNIDNFEKLCGMYLQGRISYWEHL